jgi:peptide chain release factor subunit 1
MKITLAVPSERKGIHVFIDREINAANNIKDANYKKQVQNGLKRIRNFLKEGQVYLYDSDTDELDIMAYPLNEFIYKCGKDFIVPNIQLGNRYMLVVLDQNDATIAELSGSGKMKVLWSPKSYIGGKHKDGGQSALRFQRAREGMRKAWFRKIANKMKEIYYGEQNGK